MKNLSLHFAILFFGMTFLVSLPTVSLSQSDGNEVDQIRQENSSYVKGITPARARSLAGVAFGVISTGIGWAAKRRKTANKNARPWSLAALILGIAAIALSIVHLISTSGGFGTGGGKAGAIAALSLGVVGATFGALGLRLSKKDGAK